MRRGPAKPDETIQWIVSSAERREPKRAAGEKRAQANKSAELGRGAGGKHAATNYRPVKQRPCGSGRKGRCGDGVAWAAKAAMFDLPLLFTAAAFLSESPLEAFRPSHARRFWAASGSDQRFTDFSDQNRPPDSPASGPTHRTAGRCAIVWRSCVDGPASVGPPERIPVATSEYLQVRHPCRFHDAGLPPVQTSGTSPHGADGAKLGADFVDRKGGKRFPRPVHARGRG